jgi:hypothetical protein
MRDRLEEIMRSLRAGDVAIESDDSIVCINGEGVWDVMAMETPGHRFLHVRPEFVVGNRGSDDPNLIVNRVDAPDVADLVFSSLACCVEVDGANEGDNRSANGGLHVLIRGGTEGFFDCGYEGIILGEA